MKFIIFVKGAYFLTTNSLRLSNLKTKKAKNVKVSGFVIYVKAIIYLLSYNLRECNFTFGSHRLLAPKQKNDRKRNCYIELMHLLKNLAS